MDNLETRARSFGIQPDYEGMGGTVHTAPRQTLEALVQAFGDTPALATPHELRAPAGVRCHLPEDGGRVWGVALQLYQIRSDRNWGIGDFADLEALAALLGGAGADFIGLNPLHALFLTDPSRRSPFSPSNRRFLNPIYIAVDRVAGYHDGMADADLAALRDTDLVDYPAVTALKMRVLRRIWDAQGRPDAADRDNTDLNRHALFEALSAHMVAQGHSAGWQAWPAEYHDVAGPTVAAFAREHAADIAFHRWLQQETDRQLAAARAACDAAGMGIGLYLDFAVGEAADGSGSWGDPDVMSSVRIGAPPDYFNEYGQDWGLAPLSALRMAESRAAPYRGLMEQATRQAGALRIDHAMGLWQLFLIPYGMGPAEGTYVRYPIADMLTGLAEASNKNRTLVIGEDLGNVPPGFRDVMEETGILSYRIFFFERTEDGYIPPPEYPALALACLSTHDLPTFQGWWMGDDIALRASHDLISAEAAEEQATSRTTERQELLADLMAAGLLEDNTVTDGPASPELVVAVHRHLARTPSLLFAARLEDLVGETKPVNVPSTLDEYPNWRLKLGVTLEEMETFSLFDATTRALRAERPRA
ncbi:4-alpha-glucanotransferase [Falsirhodobacter sp. 20TX0035]|uniref:4-alpha-glucanotransferase n=1 Tax=Falsirhodobacter sp. 20TX0035 TaxID=3022019 RepID=UPI002330176A|nr:4-alpha-glucanotransferase [Falsirhodobacter sp. 20TX0035]MDB6454571.1 4-alpha-glucanotransferase [Falsirhodobacter sp. 20TX0035]